MSVTKQNVTNCNKNMIKIGQKLPQIQPCLDRNIILLVLVYYHYYPVLLLHNYHYHYYYTVRHKKCHSTSANVIILHCCIPRQTAEKAGIKVPTSPQIRYCITLQNLNVQLLFTVKIYQCQVLVPMCMQINLQHVFKISININISHKNPTYTLCDQWFTKKKNAKKLLKQRKN